MKNVVKSIGVIFLVLVTFVGCASFADYKITPINRDSDKYLGKIEVSTLESHLFWNRDYTANKDAQKHIAEKLYKEAINKYGEMVEVVNVTTTTQWSPLSLFYYLSVLGFVEKTTATADVIVSDTPLQEIDYVERFVAKDKTEVEIVKAEIQAKKDKLKDDLIYIPDKMIGMNYNDLIDILGDPDKNNVSRYGDTLKRQLIYEDLRWGSTIYIYTEDNIVTSYQIREKDMYVDTAYGLIKIN